jgi:acetoin utilization deacetylase AcuC-like enzyme
VEIFSSSRFAEHVTPPGHPEAPERADVFDAVALAFRRRGGSVVEPRAATREELERVHSAAYLDAIARTSGRAVALDADTFTSPESCEVALLAAGAAIEAVESAAGKRQSSMALVRPPGHHAEADRAMGFCLYNNVAAAAAHALARGAARVAVVDYDVHHGNGTQWIFYDDPRVLYVSLHQHPFYPGTGAADEAGVGAGEGLTVNVPLEAGATDADYDAVFTALVVPVLRRFSPQVLLVSAGFDAHEHDPLASMRVTVEGYAEMTRHLQRVADACCGGVLTLVTEGGYDLPALAACLLAAIGVLESRDTSPARFDEPTYRAAQAIDAVRERQRRFWPDL